MAQKVEEKSIWEKLGTLDYRYIYATFIILCFIPLVLPISLPAKVSSITQDYYDTIMAVPDGGVIMSRQSVSLDVWIDTGSIFTNTLKILWSIPASRGITLIMVQGSTDALFKARDIEAKEAKPPADWVYGQNWVDLGYLPPLTTDAGIVSFLANFKNTATKDAYGTSVDTIPAYQKVAQRRADTTIANGYDIDLLIWFSWGCTDPDWYVRQYWTSGQPAYKIPQLFQTIGNCVPNCMPYLGKEKPIKAYVAGATGAAELEKLTGFKSIDPPGTMVADSLNLAGIGTVTFFIIGNIAFFGQRFFSKKKE